MSAGIWSYHVVIGEAKVECTFDVTSEGEIESLAVWDGDADITQSLGAHQIEELECECYDSYVAGAKEHNDDLKINNYLAGVGQ